MNIILTMTIKNGGSTVQMNSAETCIKDARVLIIIVGESGLIYSNISFKKNGLLGDEGFCTIMYFSVDTTKHFKTRMLSNIAVRTSYLEIKDDQSFQGCYSMSTSK